MRDVCRSYEFGYYLQRKSRKSRLQTNCLKRLNLKIIFFQNMAVQNELLNLLQAESEATVVYAAIVLSQV